MSISSYIYVVFNDFGRYTYKYIYVTLNTKTLSLHELYENGQIILLEKTL